MAFIAMTAIALIALTTMAPSASPVRVAVAAKRR
jgi:hypothetical protein